MRPDQVRGRQMNRLSTIFLGMVAGWDMAGLVHCFKLVVRVREGKGYGVLILAIALMMMIVVQSPGLLP